MAKRSESYVVDLGQRLIQAKADCKRLQAEWDSLFALPGHEVNSPPKGGADTTVSRIISFLDSAKSISFDTDKVMEALGLKNRSSTASTLSKLVKQGRIDKYGSDEYTSILCPVLEDTLGVSTGDEHEGVEEEVPW